MAFKGCEAKQTDLEGGGNKGEEGGSSNTMISREE